MDTSTSNKKRIKMKPNKEVSELETDSYLEKSINNIKENVSKGKLHTYFISYKIYKYCLKH